MCIYHAVGPYICTTRNTWHPQDLSPGVTLQAPLDQRGYFQCRHFTIFKNPQNGCLSSGSYRRQSAFIDDAHGRIITLKIPLEDKKSLFYFFAKLLVDGWFVSVIIWNIFQGSAAEQTNPNILLCSLWSQRLCRLSWAGDLTAVIRTNLTYFWVLQPNLSQLFGVSRCLSMPISMMPSCLSLTLFFFYSLMLLFFLNRDNMFPFRLHYIFVIFCVIMLMPCFWLLSHSHCRTISQP